MTRDIPSKSRAVVIGASVAGSLIARLLSDRFQEVVLIDRDRLPTSAEPRSTVPQEFHVHLLLQRGRQIMEQLYPGFLGEIEAAGAQIIDLSHGVKWHFGGRWKNRWPTGITAHYCSRTLVEHTLRRRAAALPGVVIRPETTVIEPLFDPDASRINGVRVANAAGEETEIEAGLVVDASGRGSQAGAWIKALGFGMVEDEQVVSRLGYVSRIYRRNPAFERQWKVLLVTPRLPADRRMAVISPIEGDRYMVTTGGWFGAFPEPTDESFLAFLNALPVRDIHDAVKTLEPAGEFKRFRMPGGLRRRFDRMAAWPRGFLVVGDALCSINPIYSQGMSVSAMQIEALGGEIDAYLAGTRSARDVFGEMIRATERSWQQAKTGDEKLPELGGTSPTSLGLLRHYYDWLADASHQSRLVTMALLKVSNLVESEAALTRPQIVLTVLKMAIARKLQLMVR